MSQSSKLFIFPLGMTALTIGVATLLSLPSTHATDPTSVEDTVRVVIDSSCGMSQTVLASGTTMNPGESSTIGSSRIAAYCNDSNGYDIYAIGYTNGEYGNTNMKSTTTTTTIPTGTSGDTSYWNMTLSPGTATSSPSYIPTIVSPFTTPTTIPTDYTKVATYPSSTAPQGTDPLTSGSYFTSTYSSHISTTQPAGVYSGAVQYVMVHPHGAPGPTFMQNTTAIKTILTNEGDTMQAIDKRDGKKYRIAKLADGNIWMAQNLDLAGGTRLYSETSDVPEGYSASANRPYYTLPTSSTSGWSNDTRAYVYNVPYDQSDRTTCANNHPCYSYYSWLAATAWSGRNVAYDDTDAAYSICPKGWKLPNSRSTPAGNSDFYRLAVAYGMDPNYISRPTSSFYDLAGPGTTADFLITGHYLNSSFSFDGINSHYWSSTSYNYGNARGLYFNFGTINTTVIGNRKEGFPVRCVVAN